MSILIERLFMSKCGKYFLFLRCDTFSEWISTNKRGRTPGWNEIHREWILLDKWVVEI